MFIFRWKAYILDRRSVFVFQSRIPDLLFWYRAAKNREKIPSGQVSFFHLYDAKAPLLAKTSCGNLFDEKLIHTLLESKIDRWRNEILSHTHSLGKKSVPP